MPCDLVVDAIIPPAALLAPCPTQVDVRIRNLGPDPARYPIGVCVTVRSAAEEPFSPIFFAVIDRGEGHTLAANQTAVATVEVRLPCQGQAWLTAEADCPRQVPGNLALAPSMTISIQPITLVPWLFAEMRVGLEDATGLITWDPAQLCANRSVVVEVTVSNQGCADAAQSETELTVTAPGPGGPVAVVIWPTRMLRPGGRASFQYRFGVPQPAPAQLAFRGCADARGVVIGQCSTANLCASTTVPVSSGTRAPLLSLAPIAPVKPGESPAVTWEVRNDCSDLGSITGQVSFAGTQLFATPTPIPVAPLTTFRDANRTLTVPAAANGIWLIGSRQLDLRVTGTGADPGPYTTSAGLQIIGEPVGPSWWSWTNFTTGWKVTFPVLGSLINRSDRASMTPSAIDVNEHLSTDPDASNDVLTPADTTFGPVGPGATGLFGLQGLSKDWEWIHPVTFAQSGPLSQTWEYTAFFALVDQFGNGYPTQTSSILSVTVTVPFSKVRLQRLAMMELIWSALALAAAAAALAGGDPLGAAAAAVVGFALWGLAIWHSAQAADPPLPDFNYDEPVEVSPTSFPFNREAAPESLRPLFTTVDLIERTRAAYAAMVRIHAKILGARIDGATEALRRQRSSYQGALGILRAAAEEVLDAAGQAAAAIGDSPYFEPGRLAEAAERLRSDLPNPELEHSWSDAGLPVDALGDLRRRMAELESLPQAQQALVDIAGGVQRLAEAIAEEAAGTPALQ